MKAFDVKDGYAIAHMLPEMGITPVIITGRKSKIVETCAQELKITELYQGVTDKLTQLKNVAQKLMVSPEQIAYIGDDLNDMDCIIYSGFTACPNDAVEEVAGKVDYVCVHNGGQGAVREFISLIAKKYGKEIMGK